MDEIKGEVKKTEKMAEIVANDDRKNNVAEEDTTKNKSNGEFQKRKRGRPKKKDGSKVEEREAEGLKRYLESGKMTGEDGIIKGKELERTPVSVRRSMGATDGKEEPDSTDEEDMIYDDEEERGKVDEKQSEMEADGEGSGGRRDKAAAEVSVKVIEWMRNMSGRMYELESRLERECKGKDNLEKEVKELREQNRIDKLEIERLHNTINEILVSVENDRKKIGELEFAMSKFDCESEEEYENENEHANRSGKKTMCDIGNNNDANGDADVRKGGKGTGVEAKSSQGDGRESPARVDEDVLKDRDYLNEIPAAMGKGELEYEMKERKNRKNSVMIRGIRTVGRRLKEEMRGVIKKYLDIDIYIKKIRPIGGGLVIDLYSLENKVEIMKRRGMLKGTDIWIDDDWTERQKEVKKWLEKIAETEKKNGLEVRVGYQKIYVDGEWYEWDDEKGELKGKNFRRERGRQGN